MMTETLLHCSNTPSIDPSRWFTILAVDDTKVRVKKHWNWPLWAGFLFALAALFSYAFFVRFPITRDFPWVNLLLFAVSGVLLAIGLIRAFRQSELYRGKILGSLFAVLSLLGFALFAYGTLYVVRQLPPAPEAPRIGQKAPDFTLPDQGGKPTALADLLASAQAGTTTGIPNAVLLIFYRGYW
jgi:hypothetical protein